MNRARVERQHQVSPLLLEEFKINVGVAPLLKQLKAAGFTIIVTTTSPAFPAATCRAGNWTGCTICCSARCRLTTC